MSVILHELFHIIMHFGNISSIHLLPNIQTGVEITLINSTGFDPMAEELIAYLISISTLIVTANVICRVHDRNSSKTIQQILFGNSLTRTIDPADILALAVSADIIQGKLAA
ncbi:MAG: hypothetical protein ABI397_01195 [Candidatus Saccharimonas sp.]